MLGRLLDLAFFIALAPRRHLLLHVRVETRHAHAERHLAKAGVANGKVFERSFLGVPLAGEPKPGGRMALESAIGAEPLSEACQPHSCAPAHSNLRVALRQEQAAVVGGGRRGTRLETGEELSSSLLG